ncbi:OmpA family protein [Profundibacter sp.]|uniref:OmpA family protein n=1 Tax=Profundibacter sp. TaxID=3101071 RepID=UPI003D128564
MRLSKIFSILAVFLIAGAASTFGAMRAADFIEERSLADVTNALVAQDQTWVSVHVDGLRVELTGTAPDEATRFKALTVANSIVDAERVINSMDVLDAAAIAPPKFSVEILRNNEGISLIGLIPASSDREEIVSSIEGLTKGSEITDMLDTSDYPAPEGWEAALKFGLNAVHDLPKSKVSISEYGVAVTAIAGSIEEKRKIEAALARKAPDNMSLITKITAPRPVITPFTTRFVINGDSVHFDACSADSADTHAKIISAALDVGLNGKTDCTIGLGVPSTSWGDAVVSGIKALKDIGGGSITFSDADVTLVALDTTPQATFDRVVGELKAALPDVFSLHAVLPEPVKIDGTGEGAGSPEFVATLSPEGQVQLRGRVTNERTRAAVDSYSRARFGSKVVYDATRLDEELPDGWPIRVLAALEALAELNHGSVVVQEDFVDVRGVTGNPEARANVARLLSEKLGASENYGIDVKYEKTLDPVAGLLKPAECVDNINDVLSERKISFAPGSAELDSAGQAVVDRIADILKTCNKPRIEIAGHTDSQGREVMNLNLSQARADAVLQGLIARKVLTTGMRAKGYGETVPIADNKTEEGREANRRIEFTLIVPEKVQEEATGLEQMEAPAVEQPHTDNSHPEAAETTPNE